MFTLTRKIKEENRGNKMEIFRTFLVSAGEGKTQSHECCGFVFSLSDAFRPHSSLLPVNETNLDSNRSESENCEHYLA